MDTQSIGGTAATTGASAPTSNRSEFRQDFRSLENALLNGDVGGAQSALNSLQQVIGSAQGGNGKSLMAQLGDSSSTLGKDLKAVSDALGANDVGAAQKAFAKLQTDMQAARPAGGAGQAQGHHHAHHAKANDGDADDAGGAQSSSGTLGSLLQSLPAAQSGGNSANDILNALQSLAKSNPKVAGDLVTLITDLNGVGAVVNTSA